MSTGVIKFAIIGCGRIAGHHCRAILNTPGAALVAVCDLDISKANAYKNEFGAEAFVNYHLMLLEHPEIDVVVIATPSGMHYKHTLDIVTRYSKNVVVEKPTFMRSSQIKEAYELANKHGVKIFPVFQNRHNSAVQRVLRGLEDGELGSVRSAAVRVRWCRPQRYYDLAPWRGTFAMDGGCLTNQGIHHIDLLRKLGGEVDSVCAVFRTLGASIEVEDTVAATFIFNSGSVGTVEITTAARPIDFEASLSLVCEKGLAQIGGIAVNELQVYSPDPQACEKYSEDFSGNVYGNGHSKIYEDIVSCLYGKQDYPVTYQDAFSTIELLNSFYLSSERGGWIKVDGAGNSRRLGEMSMDLEKLYYTDPPKSAM
jgi:UDP-N-acetyl-2-amino-2-deoxyglucuronate dehydrogenase